MKFVWNSPCFKQEKLQDTKRVIRSNKSKAHRQHNGRQKKYKQQSTKQYTEGQTTQWPTEKVQTTIYKTIHRKLKMEQHEAQLKPGMNSGRVNKSCFTSGTRRVTLVINRGHL